MALAPRESVGGSRAPFFEADKHVNDIALLIEYIDITPNVEGKFGPRDHLTARITQFRSKNAVDKGKPDMDEERTITVPPIVDELKKQYAKGIDSVIVQVEKYKPKGGGNDTFVIRPVDQATYDKVAAYYAARQEADAKALEDAPPFE